MSTSCKYFAQVAVTVSNQIFQQLTVTADNPCEAKELAQREALRRCNDVSGMIASAEVLSVEKEKDEPKTYFIKEDERHA